MSFLTYQEGGQIVLVSLAPGVDPDAEAKRVVPEGRAYKKHAAPPSLAVAVAVPRSIPMHAARITLRRHGLLAAANAAAQAAGGEVLDAWEYAPSIARSSPTMKGVQAALGLSEADVDALFVAATDLII